MSSHYERHFGIDRAEDLALSRSQGVGGDREADGRPMMRSSDEDLQEWRGTRKRLAVGLRERTEGMEDELKE